MTEDKLKARRGFACMPEDKRRAIAAKGGASVPADKRSFATQPGLAASAGAKGGEKSKGGGRKKARDAL